MRPLARCCWWSAARAPRPRLRRAYSVRVPGDDGLRTVADLLRPWRPAAGDAVPDVEVCGWVRSVRKSSGVRFVDVTDGSSMRPLQAVVDKTLAGVAECAACPPPRRATG